MQINPEVPLISTVDAAPKTDRRYPRTLGFCARGRSGTPQGPQRATGGVERAGRSPRLGGSEEYKCSTRSPGGGAWRRSAGMRPDSLRFLEDGHVKRYKKRPSYWLITSPRSLRRGYAHELEGTR